MIKAVEFHTGKMAKKVIYRCYQKIWVMNKKKNKKSKIFKIGIHQTTSRDSRSLKPNCTQIATYIIKCNKCTLITILIVLFTLYNPLKTIRKKKNRKRIRSPNHSIPLKRSFRPIHIQVLMNQRIIESKFLSSINQQFIFEFQYGNYIYNYIDFS